MKITIKTEAIQFEFEDSIKANTYFETESNHKAIEYLKELIEKVSDETIKLNTSLK